MEIALHGLMFFVVGMATAALGALGLVAQGAVVAYQRLGRAETLFSGWDDLALATLGPLACSALGAAAMWLVEEGDGPDELLDTLSPGLPVLAIAAWVAIQIAIVRARRARLERARGSARP